MVDINVATPYGPLRASICAPRRIVSRLAYDRSRIDADDRLGHTGGLDTAMAETTRYRAALFAPDGDYVTDYAAPTVAEVWDLIDDGGSRWFFYPFPVIVTDSAVIRPTQRIVDAPESLAIVKGKTLRTFARMLASLTDADRTALYDGIPLDWMVTDR